MFVRSAHKRYVKHDLQGRVNDFIKTLRKTVPSLTTERLHVEWIDPATSRKSFIDGDRVVIRLRRDDPADHNFVHASYLFISESLLRKPTRYLSPSQREAIDLFVSTKLLEAEKPEIVSVFLDEYLHPGTADRKSKVAIYIDDFAILDNSGLFFPVLLQELEFLGDKVFGRRRDDLVIREVDGFLDFLKPIAVRTIGDEGDLEFEGQYCRFAIMIIGKPAKLLESIEPYVRYISNALIPAGTETIYVLGRLENEKKIEEICGRFSTSYGCIRRVKYQGLLRYFNKNVVANQYLVVLRRQGTGIIQASA